MRGALALLAPLAACGPPLPTYREREDLQRGIDPGAYSEVRSACNLDQGEPAAFPLEPDGTVGYVTAECVEAIDAAFPFDWASFGEEPHEFSDARTPAEIVLSGFLIAAADVGAPLSAVEAAEAPEGLAEEMGDIAENLGLDPSVDSGEVWFQVLYQRVTGARYTGSQAYVLAYDHGTLLVGDVADREADEEFDPTIDPLSPLRAAMSLVHEAGHGFLGGHVPCPGSAEGAVPACDPDPEGAHGAEAWWAYTWLLENGARLEHSACFIGWTDIFDPCERILEPEGYVPCEFDGWDLCEPD